MQKWEYMFVFTRDGKVLSANKQKMGNAPLFGEVKGPDYRDYINQLGQEGWEMVSINNLSTGGSPSFLELILKRPIE